MVVSNDITLVKELEKRVEERTIDITSILVALEALVKEDEISKDGIMKLVSTHTKGIDIKDTELW